MEQFRPILLRVWQEACRHIELLHSAASFVAMLEEDIPIQQIAFWRFEPDHRRIVAVAASPASDRHSAAAAMHCNEREWKRLVAWADAAEVFGDGRARGVPMLVRRILGADEHAEFLAAPLRSSTGPVGLVQLLPKPRRQFQAKHAAMLAAIQEPLAVALENDRRLHEMTALREAAEADKRSLLSRLGRTEIADTIVGGDAGLAPVMERVRLVCRSDVPVLILGETGTGKELIARAIHSSSDRHSGPFIRVNCGAIPSELIDSHLFGHERGSFTGASESRAGWFERAVGGTLFLDEIGELPLGAQVRFLRVLQDGLVERVGGSQLMHVDVRIVAATHRDLYFMVREGRFREDLWYRINVFPILLPPLRERLGDIAALAQHFAGRAATRFGLAPVAPSAENLRQLEAYPWPGNIRELAAVIDRAAILGEGRSLEIATALGLSGRPAHSEISGLGYAASNDHKGDVIDSSATRRNDAAERSTAFESLDEAMGRHIQLALQHTHGRVEGSNGAARLLKINPHTLRARMRKLKIDWSAYRR